jgi:hypothetical protein
MLQAIQQVVVKVAALLIQEPKLKILQMTTLYRETQVYGSQESLFFQA